MFKGKSKFAALQTLEEKGEPILILTYLTPNTITHCYIHSFFFGGGVLSTPGVMILCYIYFTFEECQYTSVFFSYLNIGW